MRALIFSLLAVASLAVAAGAGAAGKQKFTGVITDSMCSEGDHSRMRMGPTDAECTVACVSIHDAMYVLYDGRQTFILSDQKTPEKLAGKKVTVTGTLDIRTKTIHVDSIAAASN